MSSKFDRIELGVLCMCDICVAIRAPRWEPFAGVDPSKYYQDKGYLCPIPEREPDGSFPVFAHWVEGATYFLAGNNALCVDRVGRILRIGRDFMMARDAGTFPVRFWYNAGPETVAQKAKSARLGAARRTPGRRAF